MGEIADMMINGDMCQECGAIMIGGHGYPRTCADCHNENGHAKSTSKQKLTPSQALVNGKTADEWAVHFTSMNDVSLAAVAANPSLTQWKAKVWGLYSAEVGKRLKAARSAKEKPLES